MADSTIPPVVNILSQERVLQGYDIPAFGKSSNGGKADNSGKKGMSKWNIFLIAGTSLVFVSIVVLIVVSHISKSKSKKRMIAERAKARKLMFEDLKQKLPPDAFIKFQALVAGNPIPDATKLVAKPDYIPPKQQQQQQIPLKNPLPQNPINTTQPIKPQPIKETTQPLPKKNPPAKKSVQTNVVQPAVPKDIPNQEVKREETKKEEVKPQEKATLESSAKNLENLSKSLENAANDVEIVESETDIDSDTTSCASDDSKDASNFVIDVNRDINTVFNEFFTKILPGAARISLQSITPPTPRSEGPMVEELESDSDDLSELSESELPPIEEVIEKQAEDLASTGVQIEQLD